MVFSFVPALHACADVAADALQQGARSAVGGRDRCTRDALVVLQVAAALVLLAGAGLMLRTMANLRAIDLGFRPDHLLTLRTTLPQTKYRDPAEAARVLRPRRRGRATRCPASSAPRTSRRCRF